MEEEERSIPVSMRAYLNSEVYLSKMRCKVSRPFKVGAITGQVAEVFPRCTFPEIRRIIFDLFPRLFSQFLFMFDENVRTDKDAIETDGIVLDLFVN